MILTKDMGEFSASHSLPKHLGGCKNCHGHNYRVKISVIGDVIEDAQSPSHGMVLDFSTLKIEYRIAVHDVLDHALILAENNWPEWYAKFVDLMGTHLIATSKDLVSFHDAIRDVDKLLGKVAHLDIPNTTAEHIAEWISKTMSAQLAQWNVRVFSVEVFETSTSSSIYITPQEVLDVQDS